MSTSVGSASAWAPASWSSELQAVRQERTKELTAELSARTETYAKASKRLDEVAAPILEQADKERLPHTAGSAIAFGAVGAAVFGTLGGLFGKVGGGPMSKLGMGIGASLGAATLGTFAGIAAHGGSTSPYNIRNKYFDEEANTAADAKEKAWHAMVDPDLLNRIDFHADYEPGLTAQSRYGRYAVNVESSMESAAKYDHDSDGAIDLRKGSPELRRDMAGGPVTADTLRMESFWMPYSEDAAADGRLTASEALATAYLEAEGLYDVGENDLRRREHFSWDQK